MYIPSLLSDKQIYQYDVNSLYPAVMLKEEMPIGQPIYFEGDISKCFDSFDHNLLIKFLRYKIKDERFIRLIIKAIKAGYFEFNIYNHSIIGTPQGSIISPILCNIYLDYFDKFVEGIMYNFNKF